MVIIGCGTGRCGTQSLAKLLNLTHERYPHMPYEFDEDIFRQWVETFTHPKGDVALYHGWHLEKYFEEAEKKQGYFKDLKVVCMRRDKDQTVESFLSLTDPNRDHWHDPITDEWDTRFPTYNHLSKPEAIAQYWEDYYAHIESLDLPILMVELENFDRLEEQRKIFEFCEIPEKDRVYRIIRTNQREHHIAYRKNDKRTNS